MYASREVLTAALSRAWGASFHIEALATETLARARIPEGLVEINPTKLGTRLGYSLHANERLDCRARILHKPRRFRRGLLDYLWTPEEWGVNAFIGCSMAVLDERGYAVTDTDTNVLHLAGLLALPGLGRNDPTTAEFVVGWFVDAYQRGRSASSNNSGLRIAAK
jgi:hypothetical protein